MNINHNALSQQLDIQNHERADIENHSGEIWECIGKKASKYGGYVYRFRMREEFDNWTKNINLVDRSFKLHKKTMEIYPAIELNARQLIFLSDSYANLIKPEWQERAHILKEIGYQIFLGHDVQFEVPDVEALRNGWKSFQKANPDRDLPELNVVESEGTADDVTFVNSYQSHDALISSGKEFIHDHTTHVITRIYRMLKGKKSYEQEKRHLNSIIDHVRTKIQEALKREEPHGILHQEQEKLDFIPGLLTDIYFSYPDDGTIERLSLKRADLFLTFDSPENKIWENYLIRRFGPNSNFEMITRLWNKVSDLVLELN